MSRRRLATSVRPLSSSSCRAGRAVQQLGGDRGDHRSDVPDLLRLVDNTHPAATSRTADHDTAAASAATTTRSRSPRQRRTQAGTKSGCAGAQVLHHGGQLRGVQRRLERQGSNGGPKLHHLDSGWVQGRQRDGRHDCEDALTTTTTTTRDLERWSSTRRRTRNTTRRRCSTPNRRLLRRRQAEPDRRLVQERLDRVCASTTRNKARRAAPLKTRPATAPPSRRSCSTRVLVINNQCATISAAASSWASATAGRTVSCPSTGWHHQ